MDIIAVKYRTLLLEALHLHFDEHLPRLEVGRRLAIPKSTICDLFVRFRKLGMSWPLPADITPGKLESLLYPARSATIRTEVSDLPEPVARKRTRRPNFPYELPYAESIKLKQYPLLLADKDNYGTFSDPPYTYTYWFTVDKEGIEFLQKDDVKTYNKLDFQMPQYQFIESTPDTLNVTNSRDLVFMIETTDGSDRIKDQNVYLTASIPGWPTEKY